MGRRVHRDYLPVLQEMNTMTIEDKIRILGTSFRGLWKSYILDEAGNLPTGKWTVTYIFRGQYIETPNLDSHHEALNFAIAIKEHETE
jgi:hypothetical protein